jgi:hypothetical protein
LRLGSAFHENSEGAGRDFPWNRDSSVTVFASGIARRDACVGWGRVGEEVGIMPSVAGRRNLVGAPGEGGGPVLSKLTR